jgi:predicted Zn-dependent peptidase
MYQHQLISLKNGLRLVTIPMPQVESTTVMVGVGAGSRYETKQVNGLFHFIEHMAFKGTKNRPSALKIASEVDAVGGEFNAFTSKEFTGYYLKLAAKHQGLAFTVLADILLNSLLKPAEIEREKGVIIEEINMREDTPTQQIWDVFLRLLYGDNPMGWPISGEKATVKKIERQDFLKYINDLYTAQNMVVAVAGKLEERAIKELTDQSFSRLKKRGKVQKKTFKTYQNMSKIKLVYKKTEQGHFVLGVPGYWYGHSDRFGLGVLATILGASMSSRLFIEIREKRGLAYYVEAMPDFYTDSGYLLTRAGVKLAEIDEAIKVTRRELQKLIDKKVGIQELKKAKEFLKGRMVLALEDSYAVASRYAAQVLLERKIRTPEEAMRLVDKVTADDVQRVAKDIFKPGKLNLVIIGPYREENRFKKLLK